MMILKISYLIIGKFFSLFVIFILMLGCTNSSNLKKDNKKIVYFHYMIDWSHEGRMTFRGRTSLENIKRYKKENTEGYNHYYKVYHNGLPIQVEVYRFYGDTPQVVYWFNKDAINTKIRKYKNRDYIDCNLTYLTVLKIKKQIENCNNGTKTVKLYDGWRWEYTYFYKNNQRYKKKIHNKDNKVNIYENNKVTTYLYEEPDIYPMEIPELDRYPWKNQ